MTDEGDVVLPSGATAEQEAQRVAPIPRLVVQATELAQERHQRLVQNLTMECKALTKALEELDAEQEAVSEAYALRRTILERQLKAVQAGLSIVRPSEGGGPTSSDVSAEHAALNGPPTDDELARLSQQVERIEKARERDRIVGAG